MNNLIEEKITIIGVLGSNRPSEKALQLAEELGRAIIDHGYFLVTGGLGGIMEAISKGGRSSPNHRKGMIIGIIPTYEKKDANKYVDVIIPTGMGFARNLLVVSTSDIVVTIGGGAGTLSEIAFAWQLKKPLIALSVSGGWSEQLAGKILDHRREEAIIDARSVNDVFACIERLIVYKMI